MKKKIYETIYEVELNHWWYKYLHYLIEETLCKEANKFKRSLGIFDIGCGNGNLIKLPFGSS